MKVRTVLIFLFSLLTLLGCGRRTIGFGVILWSPDEQAVATGQLVPIHEESRINRSLIIGVPAQRTLYEIPAARVRVFRTRNEAEDFAASFEPIRHLFALSERRALPIRERPNRFSLQVYRLRQDQLIKIIAKGTEPSNENGLIGYWHKVLTEDGTVGYCFDYHLTLYDGKTQTRIASTRDPNEERLALLLSTIWRPVFFQRMVNTRRIDLELFRPEYGLFITLEPPLLRIVTPTENREFPFSSISVGAGNRFFLEGTTAILTMDGNAQTLTVTYQERTNQKTIQFAAFGTDVEEIILQEKERRQSLLTAFLARATTLLSTGFGEITLNEDGTFQWVNFDRLIPSVLSAEVRGTGKIEFSTFQGPTVQGEFDGSLSFRFDGGRNDRNTATFLYQFTQGGVRFLFIPQNLIRDSIIQGRPSTPLTLFFSIL